MRTQDPIKLINLYGLKPTTKRRMTLFGASCVAEAYVLLLKDLIGFSYDAIGVYGNSERLVYFMNEKKISQLVGKFLQLKKKSFITESLDIARKLHSAVIPKLIKGLTTYKKDPKKFLLLLTAEYPKYFAALGIYNCFWRFLGDDSSRLAVGTVKKIARARDQASIIYPRIETAIQDVFRQLNEGKETDANLLAGLTLDEMKKFLSTNKLPAQKKLDSRAKAYFYLLENSHGDNLLISNQELNKKIEKKYLEYSDDETTIKGQVGYPGLIRGIVHNLDFAKKNKPPKNFILVASTTNPNNTSLIRRSRAIVSDEGGILGHAAIISRELKIPCVIGTKIATCMLREGDLIEVDAHRGIVRIIKRHK